MEHQKEHSAVVTGAASGIGRALATLLAQSGHALTLADTNEAELARVGEALAAKTVVTDVSDAAAMERLADVAGEVSLVCLNAGVVSTHAGPVWETPATEWERVFAVNTVGVLNGLRAFVPRLLSRPQASRILITASLAGLATWPGGGPYAASKHAVVTLAEQARLALADTNVGVSMLCPALVRSGMSEHGADPMDVARDALAEMQEGRFAIVPDEWREAIRQRGEALAAGLAPTMPEPTS